MLFTGPPHQYINLVKFHFTPPGTLLTAVYEMLEAEEFSLTGNQTRSSLITLNPHPQTIRKGVFLIANLLISRCNY